MQISTLLRSSIPNVAANSADSTQLCPTFPKITGQFRELWKRHQDSPPEPVKADKYIHAQKMR
jgi:hypothetical protein